MRFPSILTLAVIAASPLAGQQRFTGRIAAVVESLGVAAAARGLPVDPVIEKAIEGSAKGIPAERVTAALRVIVDQLDTAAASLRDGGISGDTIAIAAGEFAITAGLHGRDITELARTGRPAADVTVGLRVAGTLAALGVPRPESVKLVSTELRLGRPPADLLALPGRRRRLPQASRVPLPHRREGRAGQGDLGVHVTVRLRERVTGRLRIRLILSYRGNP